MGLLNIRLIASGVQIIDEATGNLLEPVITLLSIATMHHFLLLLYHLHIRSAPCVHCHVGRQYLFVDRLVLRDYLVEGFLILGMGSHRSAWQVQSKHGISSLSFQRTLGSL
jgi:hypothetical protein